MLQMHKSLNEWLYLHNDDEVENELGLMARASTRVPEVTALSLRGVP